MPLSVDQASEIHGIRAVTLESDWFLSSIFPSIGAKIYDLVWKPTGKNILWHNPRIPPQAYTIDGNFDNYWCGGWDDGFPTCDPCEHAGEHYGGLGELRSLGWHVEEATAAGDRAFVRLSAFGPINPVRAEKTVTLSADSPVLRMRSKITNIGYLPLDFVWGTHPALVADKNLILRIPAKTGIVGQATNPRLGMPGQRYAWPRLDTPCGVTDMSRVLDASAGIACGHTATDLGGDWYAVEDLRSGEGFLLKFPLEQCPCLWMWLAYGGWRGHHHIIIEPWTSYPNKLCDAVKEGTHRTLAPGGQFAAEVAATVYTRAEGYQGALRRLERESVREEGQ